METMKNVDKVARWLLYEE